MAPQQPEAMASRTLKPNACSHRLFLPFLVVLVVGVHLLISSFKNPTKQLEIPRIYVNRMGNGQGEDLPPGLPTGLTHHFRFVEGNFTPSPIWRDAKTEPDAVYLLSQGTWLPGSLHISTKDAYAANEERGSSFLNSEELSFLTWSKNVTSQMTVEKASSKVAFKLWGSDFSSLYGTAQSLSYIRNSQYFCRLSWGFHWCDPINHGLNYHSMHWSTTRGIELLESFVRLSDAGRHSPSILFMGDSVVMETWQAGLCSLARANVKFVNPCPESTAKRIHGVGLACFQHDQVNGTGILAALSDQGFVKENWKRAIFGCEKDVENCVLDGNHSINYFNWDVVLPNLGVHYNLDPAGDFKNGNNAYRDDLADLFGFLLDHAEHQLKMGFRFPTLHAFWGSSPQHFNSRSLDGLFVNQATFEGCVAIHPSKTAYLSNRRRSEVVWEVLIEQLSTRVESELKCPRNFSVPNDPSYSETKLVLNMPCMSEMLNTCHGGITHLEVEPFLTNRPEAHPGARCAYTWPIEYENDPDGEKCDPERNMGTDCTHHCWGPLLFHPIWERLEISVKFHLDRCLV